MSKIILAIETSNLPTSVALLKDSELLGIKWNEIPQQTSAVISAQIDELITEHLDSVSEIDEIVVSLGPGSYTGLRVGLSTAKGLSFALEKPLKAIHLFRGILDTYLIQNKSKYDFYVPLINANNGNTYLTVYDSDFNRIEKFERKSIDELNWTIENKKNGILLPLNQCFSAKFAKSKWACEVVNFSALELGLASENERDLSLHEIAYLEPLYIINNYNKKT